jgi:hypothetical protein
LSLCPSTGGNRSLTVSSSQVDGFVLTFVVFPPFSHILLYLSDPKEQEDKVLISACGDVDHLDDDDDDMEEMFVDAHESFDHKTTEWGGPRRGGRLPEPTRYGDWERKGRCSDF